MHRLLRISLAFVVVSYFGACGSADHPAAASGESPIIVPPSTGSDSTGARASTPPTIVVSADACTSDADCVPAGCCHPAACVARVNAPVCVESVCTSDCRYETLDCGGACLCQQGHCAARLSQRPNIPGISEVQ